MRDLILEEYRCSCGKLLFKGSLFVSVIEIKCRRCGVIKSISGKNVPVLFFLDHNGEHNHLEPHKDATRVVLGNHSLSTQPYMTQGKRFEIQKIVSEFSNTPNVPTIIIKPI